MRSVSDSARSQKSNNSESAGSSIAQPTSTAASSRRSESASSLFLRSAVTALTHRLSAASLMSSSILKPKQALDEIKERADLPHEQHHRRDETGQAYEHCLIRTVRAHEQLIEHGDDDAHRCDLEHEVNIHRRLPYVKRLSFSITL